MREKIDRAFEETTRRAEEAGFEEWADRVALAADLWGEREKPGLSDYELALLALDATIAAQAAGPGSGLVVQWRRVVEHLGNTPDAIPDDMPLDAYLRRVSPLRFARTLALIMLDPANPDRDDPEARAALDRAAASIMVSHEAMDASVPSSADRLLDVIRVATDLLEESGLKAPGVQNTRSRIEYLRSVLSQPGRAPKHDTARRWPTAREATEAASVALGIMLEISKLFRGVGAR